MFFGEEFFGNYLNFAGCFFGENILDLEIPINLFDIGIPAVFGIRSAAEPEYNYFFGRSIIFDYRANYFFEPFDLYFKKIENHFDEINSRFGNKKYFFDSGFFENKVNKFFKNFELFNVRFIENRGFLNSFGKSFSELLTTYFNCPENAPARFFESDFFAQSFVNIFAAGSGFFDIFLQNFFESKKFSGSFFQNLKNYNNFSRIFAEKIEELLLPRQLNSYERSLLGIGGVSWEFRRREFLSKGINSLENRFLNRKFQTFFLDQKHFLQPIETDPRVKEIEVKPEINITPKNIFSAAAAGEYSGNIPGNEHGNDDREGSPSGLNRRLERLEEMIRREKKTFEIDYDSVVRRLDLELRAALNSCSEGVHF